MPGQVLLAPPAPGDDATREALIERYRQVRALTERLCEPLVPEDYVVQSCPEASPVKWHLAHTAWFFETFVLARLPGHEPYHPRYRFLFNSYYEALGERWQKADRGVLSRPTVREVHDYRHAIDEHIDRAGRQVASDLWRDLAPVIELGLHHEQQHQELLLTDIKHAFAVNPLQPVYRPDAASPTGRAAPPLTWQTLPEAIRAVGHRGPQFAFDNEKPRHRVLVPAFRLAARPVTAGEYLAFMADGGYTRPGFWLSDGWRAVQAHGWRAPLYWDRRDGGWHHATLGGWRTVDPAEPVAHLSFYEADAYARWAGARLPTEAEWEAAAAPLPVEGNLLDSQRLHPEPAPALGLTQLFGDVWEWTASPYVAYPGYRPPDGALGEYNAKFMCNTLVLRGGSCLTPRSHLRPTYRNFFSPDTRWQCSGLRLASDA